MKLFRYRLRFKKPFRTALGCFKYREGLLVSEDYLSFSCFGDIAPLPGFSNESLQDVIHQFQSYKNLIEHFFMQVNGYSNWKAFADSLNLYPSLRFGLDTFVYDRLSKTQMVPMYSHLSGTSLNSFHINYTLSLEDSDKNLQMADAAWENGYRTFKIKVGSDFGKEKQLIAEIRERFPSAKIRIDANSAWTVKEAISNLQTLENLQIEYCEQPVPSDFLKNTQEVHENTTIPIAADEAFRDLNFVRSLIVNQAVDILIIKPMLIGSYGLIEEIVSEAHTKNIEIVFTSMLESGVGRLATAQLASTLGSFQYAQGLSTGCLFDNDILDDSGCIHNGVYYLPEERGIGIYPDVDSLESLVPIENL